MAANKTMIQQDFYRESGQWLAGVQLLQKLYNPNLLFIYILRKCQATTSKSVAGIWWRILLRRYQIKYGYQIYPQTTIGAGFYLGHWGAVVINPKTTIGKNCNIAQGVTIGQQNRGSKKGVPTIGDYVWIGANAVIVGKITIGNNVLIAPNAYVTCDIPDNSIFVGNPGKIIPREDATDGYINNTI